jgi:glutaminyl-tRNA synthetase
MLVETGLDMYNEENFAANEAELKNLLTRKITHHPLMITVRFDKSISQDSIINAMSQLYKYDYISVINYSLIDNDSKGEWNILNIFIKYKETPDNIILDFARSVYNTATEVDYNVYAQYGNKKINITKDVKWLCPDWEERIFYASNYFGKMYDYAVELIKKGLAFVDDLSADEIREYRGTLTEPGKESPYRNRTVEENLELFEKMKNGEFKDGERVLRAKIDMASPNINMRDPVIYRILHESHYNTGDEWCIYPMYDFAHPLEDAIEGITHSICTLEFEDHRPFYDWVLSNIDDFKDAPTKQIEFAKLFLSKTMMGKRYLKQMVEEGYVDGWDDPRMPTIAGFRRRGYTPEAIHNFCEAIGVSKAQSVVDIAMLEFAIRDDLGPKVPRTMAVLDPIKLIITNYPEDKIEYVEAENNPDNPDMGTRMIPFTREVYIEREDFMENPPKKYFRLFPGNEVRLRNAYFVKCVDFVKDEDGNVTEVHCTYDPETKSGSGFTGRKVKGTLHWVSAKHCIDAEVRLYDYMMEDEDYDKTNFLEKLNPESKVVLKNCKVEPSMKEFKAGDRFQFLRHGYFIIDRDTREDNLVFNRIVSLKSSFKGAGHTS